MTTHNTTMSGRCTKCGHSGPLSQNGRCLVDFEPPDVNPGCGCKCVFLLADTEICSACGAPEPCNNPKCLEWLANEEADKDLTEAQRLGMEKI